jgi:GNAT superfamily N-acetyltransferase
MRPIAVNIATRPDLIPTVAGWLFEAFWRQDGHAVGDVVEELRLSADSGFQQTFVLLINNRPAGTASLVAHDLQERPELTPWLAAVFVAPQFRGNGYAAHLIEAVEQAARAEAVKILWLFTNTAERVYSRAGWRTAEIFQLNGRPTALMRRDLS